MKNELINIQDKEGKLDMKRLVVKTVQALLGALALTAAVVITFLPYCYLVG